LIKTIKTLIGVAFVAGAVLVSTDLQEQAYDPNEPGTGGQSIEPIEEEV